ncbi:hypothetical protein N1028_16280 [Herbiconiux sp. CPCC 203407]|uniref:Uncharacterized protein n=1 Tax=Herbiconiux oxytropis TaxID=2970915 RepID=A0AA41XIZ8_9MICO|nr:hypothetical protein [Herbiconiux oxytropis]MCS5724068.1 hypothetical protein [Herbiconiux oxytropis]MCS5727454.1 hypothetical protein [Herbiconiux oxytropis]
MPYRTHTLLSRWVSEFTAAHTTSSTIEVLRQDGFDEDTGLVVLRPRGVDTELYLEPASPGASRFVITLTRTDADITVDSLELLLLSEELKTASLLCDFLEIRSREREELHRVEAPRTEDIDRGRPALR